MTIKLRVTWKITCLEWWKATGRSRIGIRVSESSNSWDYKSFWWSFKRRVRRKIPPKAVIITFLFLSLQQCLNYRISNRGHVNNKKNSVGIHTEIKFHSQEQIAVHKNFNERKRIELSQRSWWLNVGWTLCGKVRAMGPKFDMLTRNLGVEIDFLANLFTKCFTR